MATRVLFPFVGDSVGGSHISSTLLIKHLDPARYRPVVLLQQDGPLAGRLDQMGIRYLIEPLPELAGEVPSFARVASAAVRSLPVAIARLRHHDIALVHTNDLRMHLTWLLPARLSGQPWLWHQRMILSGSPVWQAQALSATRILCISRAVRDSLPRQGRAKAVVLYNPVEIDVVTQEGHRPHLLAEIGASPDAMLVGFVGNMTEQKRPLIFVEAAADMIRQSRQPLHFLLFGDDRGGQRRQAEALAAARRIGKHLHFMGHRSPVEPWIAGLDLLLCPGVGDGFGRTLIEAMIARTPVIAVASGGHREIIEDGRTGWLVPADEPLAMAKQALFVLSARDARATVVDAAFANAITTFSAEQHAMRVMSVYDQIRRSKGV